MKMNMIRKVTSALIALTLCCFVAGCGGQEAAVTLLPGDAFLVEAPDIVVEPDEEPYNLGGWVDGNTVYWDFEIEKEGMYTLLIEYSRPGTYPETKGLLVLEGPEETDEFTFSALPTGAKESEDDWSVYTVNDGSGSRLVPGEYTLSIAPNFGEDYDGPPHFINLRSVKLVKDYEG
jgi:hypothetical protein